MRFRTASSWVVAVMFSVICVGAWGCTTSTGGNNNGDAGQNANENVNTAYACDPNALAHYLLDDIEGTTAPDCTGHGHDGTIQGAVSVPGASAQALRFDGVDDHVSLGSLDVEGSEITLCAWVNPEQLANCTPSSDCRIVSKAVGTEEQDHYWMLSTWLEDGEPRLRFRLKTQGTTSTLVAGTGGGLTDGEWAHVAAVYDGVDMILYKNGQEVGRQATSGTIDTSSSVNTWIGANPDSDKRWEGAIDDVRIYAEALTQAELSAMHAQVDPNAQCSAPGDCPPRDCYNVDCQSNECIYTPIPGCGDECQPTPGELLIADEVYTYDGSLHGFKWWQLADVPGAPTNWKTPYDYELGEFYLRFEVISQATNEPALLQFGFWQDRVDGVCVRETMSEQLETNGPGSVVTTHSSPTTWWEMDDNNPVDFTRGEDFCQFGVPLWSADPRGLVTDWGTNNEWDRRHLYHPMTVRATIVAVPQGGTFSGWDCWLGNSGDALSFSHHYIDDNLASHELNGQPSLADYDNDGDLDITVGSVATGQIHWYENQGTGWVRHDLGTLPHGSLSGMAMDVNQDGWPDLVIAGEWYENPGNPRTAPFIRHTYDSAATDGHDLVAADIDGDTRKDVVALSDTVGLYWYRIPADPTDPWPRVEVGGVVHGGFFPNGVGDLDGDGDNDIVRANVWFENQNNGANWVEHAFNVGTFANEAGRYGISARSALIDVDGDNDLDIAMTECDEVDSEGAVLINVNGDGSQWALEYLPQTAPGRRSSLHSMLASDFNLDGEIELISVDQEDFHGLDSGLADPRWYVWREGPSGWYETVLFDNGLGGHDTLMGDVDGDGDYDMVTKVWTRWTGNAASGNGHADFYENMAIDGATVRLDTGSNLNGWTVGGGRWTVVDGAIVGEQEPPGSGNGGLLLSDGSYGDFDLAFEVWPDYGVDTGVYVRCDGTRAYQVTVDYQPTNPMGGIWFAGWNAGVWDFEIVDEDEISGTPQFFSLIEWKQIWKPHEWNKFLVRVYDNPPTIEIFINNRKVFDYTDTQQRLGDTGQIALQVHDGAGEWPAGAVTRFRNIRITPR